jgi:hypothetical protein
MVTGETPEEQDTPESESINDMLDRLLMQAIGPKLAVDMFSQVLEDMAEHGTERGWSQDVQDTARELFDKIEAELEEVNDDAADDSA